MHFKCVSCDRLHSDFLLFCHTTLQGVVCASISSPEIISAEGDVCKIMCSVTLIPLQAGLLCNHCISLQTEGLVAYTASQEIQLLIQY